MLGWASIPAFVRTLSADDAYLVEGQASMTEEGTTNRGRSPKAGSRRVTIVAVSVRCRANAATNCCQAAALRNDRVPCVLCPPGRAQGAAGRAAAADPDATGSCVPGRSRAPVRVMVDHWRSERATSLAFRNENQAATMAGRSGQQAGWSVDQVKYGSRSRNTRRCAAQARRFSSAAVAVTSRRMA
jgi:hypothetical protein